MCLQQDLTHRKGHSLLTKEYDRQTERQILVNRVSVPQGNVPQCHCTYHSTELYAALAYRKFYKVFMRYKSNNFYLTDRQRKNRNIERILLRRTERKRQYGRSRSGVNKNIKINLQEKHLFQGTKNCRAFVNSVMSILLS